jgi:hypothetical protein
MTTQEFLQKDITGTEAQVKYAKTLISKVWDDCVKWNQKYESGKESTVKMYNEGAEWPVKDAVTAYRALQNETNAGKIIEHLKKV